MEKVPRADLNSGPFGALLVETMIGDRAGENIQEN